MECDDDQDICHNLDKEKTPDENRILSSILDVSSLPGFQKCVLSRFDILCQNTSFQSLPSETVALSNINKEEAQGLQ